MFQSRLDQEILGSESRSSRSLFFDKLILYPEIPQMWKLALRPLVDVEMRAERNNTTSSANIASLSILDPTLISANK